MGVSNSPHAQHFINQPGFTQVTPNLSGGSSPDRGETFNPVTTRSTRRCSPISEGTRAAHNGLNQDLATGRDRPVCVLTVDDNDFTTGPAVVRIGDYEFTAGVDFQIGALAGNTASNIAALFQNNGLHGHGWGAAAVGAEVAITYPHPGRVRCNVAHYGTIENFSIQPADGLLLYGDVRPGAPALT